EQVSRDVVEVERQDIGTGARSLGGLIHESKFPGDRDHGSVRKLKVAADVQEVEVPADDDSSAGAAQEGAVEYVERIQISTCSDPRARSELGKGDSIDRPGAV